ncbi:MAG TPA: DUF456 domain-containing protein [Propionicimonas sp.]|uniref:DUF456 domain-containing protein n=1 Tax=Propionicimonas sp. TaxID=1955623 RepID=UPI002F3F5FF2
MLQLLVGLAILVGLVGIVIPVLPGSILIGLAVLVWAVLTGTPAAWLVFAICAVLLASGAMVTWIITARHTRAAGVPQSSLAVAGLAGIVGFFVVPVIGLLLFFPAGLFLAEYLRQRDGALARHSAMVALKATGLGILSELGLALLASAVWLVAVLSGV